MRLNLMLVVAAVAGLTSFSAMAAQENEGQYAADLQRMITDVASGSCPTDIMAGPLLAACQEQLPQMSAGLAELGAVQSVTFVSAEDTPDGRIETYTVTFATGVTLTWGIGSKQDGKYASAYTAG
jgi:hypothetical protein